MDDPQNLMWEYSEQFIYYTVWPWRFAVAKILMHSVQALLSRILGWSHFLGLDTLDSSFVIWNWRVKGSGMGEDVLAYSQG